jgi:hypothetical protein
MKAHHFFSAILAVAPVACSALIDVDGKQCVRDSDCTALRGAPRGAVCVQSLCVSPSAEAEAGAAGTSGAPDDPLACVAQERSQEPSVKYSFAPIFAPGGEPAEPKPFTVKACEQLDLTCDKPVYGPIDVNPGEPQDFMVPVGFNGYFEIQNPDTLGGLFFMGRPVQQDTVGWNVTMPTPELVAALGSVTREDIDPELGIILVDARACDGSPLEGVTVSNSKGGLGYYFLNYLPDASLTKTSPQGAAGFANVPISTTALEGVHESGKKLGPVSLRVRPHYMSFTELWP